MENDPKPIKIKFRDEKPKKQLSDAKKREIVREYRSGAKITEVAKSHGVSVGSIHAWAKQFKIRRTPVARAKHEPAKPLKVQVSTNDQLVHRLLELQATVIELQQRLLNK